MDLITIICSPLVFLNDKVDENLEQYTKTFDVVLTCDTSMMYVEELLKEIGGVNT